MPICVPAVAATVAWSLVMTTGTGSFSLALFLVFLLEYREGTKQVGLARQFQRTTRWSKTVARAPADTPVPDGEKEWAGAGMADDGRMTRP